MFKIVVSKINDHDSLQNLINNTKVNRFGGCFTPDRSHPPAKIAEFADKYRQLQCSKGREPRE